MNVYFGTMLFKFITMGFIFCQALAPNSSPKPLVSKPKGLGLTLKYYGPPPHHPTTQPHPMTFKHEGGVPQQNPKSKTFSEWSPLLVRHPGLDGLEYSMCYFVFYRYTYWKGSISELSNFMPLHDDPPDIAGLGPFTSSYLEFRTK